MYVMLCYVMLTVILKCGYVYYRYNAVSMDSIV